MNRINFNQTGGFPLDTDIMGAMQTAYSIFNQLGSLAGDKAIISGCNVIGNNISDGVIFLNSEILPFKGGTLAANVIIKEESESRVFEDGATKAVIFKRYATFGSSTPEKTFAWGDFKRFDNLLENAEKNADFEARLKALESKKSPVPIGLIAIWGKPATEPIPEGWRECIDLRGRFPLGWNPDDEDFSELGKVSGEKSHTLTIEEMPEHHHKQGSESLRNFFGGGMMHNDFRKTYPQGNADYSWSQQNTSTTGGNQPHNNMPPYRIIKYIEFVGFN